MNEKVTRVTIERSDSLAGTIQRTVLRNGLAIVGCERPRLSTVAVRLRVYAGASHDTDATEGLARLVGVMLRHGTARYGYEELSAFTDGLGASVGEEVQRPCTDLVVRCLAEDFPRLVELLAELARRPLFPANEFERVRGVAQAAVLRTSHDTRVVAERGFRAAAYPAGHPYRRGVLGREETLAALSRDELRVFHAAFYRPDAMALAVVGGIGFADAAAIVEDAFGDWASPDAPLPAPAPPGVPALAMGSRVDFALPGKAQADMVIGLPAVGRDNPAYYALDTTNLILGRMGLYGRLGHAVREEQGLAYYAYSMLDGGRGPVAWTARAGVDPANLDRAIATIVAEIARAGQEPFTIDELADARAFLTGSLALGVESSGGLALALLNIEFYALGLDFLTRYPEIVGALTREELLDATRRFLRPDALTVAVAGPGAATADVPD